MVILLFISYLISVRRRYQFFFFLSGGINSFDHVFAFRAEADSVIVLIMSRLFSVRGGMDLFMICLRRYPFVYFRSTGVSAHFFHYCSHSVPRAIWQLFCLCLICSVRGYISLFIFCPRGLSFVYLLSVGVAVHFAILHRGRFGNYFFCFLFMFVPLGYQFVYSHSVPRPFW